MHERLLQRVGMHEFVFWSYRKFIFNNLTIYMSIPLLIPQISITYAAYNAISLKLYPLYALFLEQSYLMLECKHFRTIDGFGGNSLITGTILHAYVHPDYLRVSEQDEQQLLHEHPLLAYVAEGRFSRVAETYHFPFPKGFNR